MQSWERWERWKVQFISVTVGFNSVCWVNSSPFCASEVCWEVEILKPLNNTEWITTVDVALSPSKGWGQLPSKWVWFFSLWFWKENILISFKIVWAVLIYLEFKEMHVTRDWRWRSEIVTCERRLVFWSWYPAPPFFLYKVRFLSYTVWAFCKVVLRSISIAV